MLTKIKSKKIAKIRLLYFTPVLLGLLVAFACNQVDNKEISIDNDAAKKVELLEDKVYMEVEKMPEFSGGDLALRTFIAQNVKYPEKAKETGTEGKVFVQFVVNKDGIVEQVKHLATKVPQREENQIGEVVVVGYSEVFDKNGMAYDDLAEEAVRVVSKLPKWKPGENKGKKVKVSFTVPINFALN